FSKTAYDRLPAAVRKLERDAQTVCIHLRLRKTTARIAAEMNIAPDEASRLEELVRRTLIATGNYDLIADPQFVQIGEEGAAEPAAGGAGDEDRILAGEFLRALKSSLASLAPGERRILHLFFGLKMTANSILDFQQRSELDIEVGGKPVKTPADVFSAVEKALKKLLGALTDETPIGRGTLTVKGLKEVLDQTGVEAA
ncbi:MAG: hypothetical protein HZA04_06905, partial [Nitrospinae bacterium]|nr:hypothetical protein [Nitrospinota bacterium]